VLREIDFLLKNLLVDTTLQLGGD